MSQSSDYVPPPPAQSRGVAIGLVLVAGLVLVFALVGFVGLVMYKRARARVEAELVRLEAITAVERDRRAQLLAAQQAYTQIPLIDQVDELLQELVPLEIVGSALAGGAELVRDKPGCAVAIVHHGQLVYSRGIGTADLEQRVEITPETMFETASFSKSLTCVCLALLMDEGKISPEDDVRKFVPEMHAFDPPIRIADLVRCRSGLWDQVSLPILVGWENAPQQFPHTRQDFFDLLVGQKRLPFQPGSEFRYSSGDYFLLGVIIERVSSLSLVEFARQQVFDPLGMTHTLIEEDPTAVLKNRAAGHYTQSDEEWHLWRPTAYWAGGGGLKTCVEDLYRWDQNFAHNVLPPGQYLDELLQEGTLLGNRSCLDVDAYAKANDPDLSRESPPGEYRGLKRRQFTGGAWGFTTAVTQFPDQEFAVICLSNSDKIVAWNINRQIADIFLADQLEPIPERASAQAASELPTATVDESQLRDKVGAYRIKSTRQIWRISFEDGSLRVTDHLLATHAMRPLSATTFDPEGPFYATTQFVFSRTADDAPWALVSQWDEPGNRGRLDFERVELFEPTPEQLSEYSGEYVSDELAATYRLAIRDGQLWLRVNSRRWEQLDATVRDEFIPHVREPADGRIITFLRNEAGALIGLTVEYYRVSGVRFTKR